ncbi:MAG: alpha-E domain-containing protein [Pseudomonadota bacterium]
MHNLLSRQAEAIFWMARQIERCNNVARVLDVTASFGREDDSANPWSAVLALYSDEAVFDARYAERRAEDIVYFYTLDRENPNSIINNVGFARENARALRPLLSTEMWTQLNVFNSTLLQTKRSQLRDEKVSDFCAEVKRNCQTHGGLVAETLFRDEEWYFYGIGLNLERADQTTRLVDVKYHILLPSNAKVGSQVDVSQWNAVLRSAAGFQAYRRVYHRGLTGEKVAAFLLLDQRLPRSVRSTTNRACKLLEKLIERYQLSGADQALKQAQSLAEQTEKARIDAIIANGMHEWIDDIQCDIIQITASIADAFFLKT